MTYLIGILSKKVFQEGVWVVLTQASTFLLSIQLIRILTQNIAPNDYGKFILGVSIVAFILQVMLGGVGAAATRFYSIFRDRGEGITYLSQVFWLYGLMLLSSIPLVFTIVSVGTINDDQTNAIFASFAIIGYASFYGFFALLNNILNISRRRIYAGLGQLMDPLMKITIFSLLLNYFSHSLHVAVYSFTITSFLLVFSQYFIIRRLFITRVSYRDITKKSTTRKELINFAVPFLPWTFIIWLQQISDRWIIEHFLGLEVVGIYAVMYQIGYSTMTALYTVTMRFIQPLVYDSHGKVESKKIDKLTLNILGSIGCVLTLISWLFHENIISYLLSNSYRSYSELLPWFIISATLFGASEIYLLRMQAQMRSKQINKIKLLMGSLGVFISYIFIKTWGVEGAVWGIFTYSFINFIIMKGSANEG